MTAQEAVAANPAWYHTIELAPGVVTPGQIDHRAVVDRVLPEDLRGKRALDVGTFDGFWAFELERRGAEVVAIDVGAADEAQWPPLQRERLRARAREGDIELGRGARPPGGSACGPVRGRGTPSSAAGSRSPPRRSARTCAASSSRSSRSSP